MFTFPSVLLTENNFLRRFFRGPFFRGPFFRGPFFRGPFFRGLPVYHFFGDLFSKGPFFQGPFFREFFSPSTIFSGTFFLRDHFSGDHFSRYHLSRDLFLAYQQKQRAQEMWIKVFFIVYAEKSARVLALKFISWTICWPIFRKFITLWLSLQYC